MKKIIVFNWKMNPLSEAEAGRLAKVADSFSVIIAPPFVFLDFLAHLLKKASLAAQDLFWEEKGAFTGEISPTMLKKLGVSYVIVGHSERRLWLKETDQMINKKILAGLSAGLKVILCVGENLAIRQRGLKAVKNFISHQLEKDLKNINDKSKLITSNLIFAYEPIWAIGTGKNDKPEDTVEIAKFIKKSLITNYQLLNPKVLYGGSVNSKNLASFLNYSEIDGALIGGASLKVQEVKKIISFIQY